MTSARQLRFASFRLDAANACLWRGAKAIHLAPKAFAVLQYLAARPGQLVTKNALLEALWPGTVVGDAVLKVSVREIRKALGDRAAKPRIIATVHRLGYRFVADVADAEGEIASARPPLAEPPPLSRAARYRGPAHLVGREPVLDHLQTWFEAAWRGSRQVVFVVGEPGIGKTAVVDAFLERTGANPRVWIGRGQCVEMYGAG